jgi:hypothetical protein
MRAALEFDAATPVVGRWAWHVTSSYAWEDAGTEGRRHDERPQSDQDDRRA